ncbi:MULTISPECIES: restriction endonuclease subunit S, partial [Roseburia]|uniref:restriction endonuclease subunit S n=1 Tax=Roseburia TaxID=841 RepID=UPI001D11AEC3
MAKYKLDELCEFITDGTHQTPEYCDDGVIFLSSKDVTERKINWDDVRYIPDELHEKLYKRLSPRKNDILLAKNGTTGVAAIVDRDEIFDVYVSLAVLRPLETIYPKYLLYAINSPVAKRQFNAGLKGIGVPNLHLGVIRETIVNVAQWDEQKKVCEILDRVANLIEKRKTELDMLDNLIKARFVELFGMPVSNTKGWSTESMEDVAPIVNYKGEFHEEVWLLNLDMVEAQTGRIIDYLIVTEDEVGNSTCTFDTSNVLYSKLRPYLNKVVIPNRCGYATSELVPLQPVNTKINREYLAFMLRNDEFVNMINEKVAGAKMPRVSMNDFRKFDVPVPPIELQNQFADFVHQVDKSKVAVQKALDETQMLFDSLMQ